MTCLLSSRLCSIYVDFAEKLLKEFVAHSCKLYGPEFCVYNVHNLIHLADDARNFGPLDNVSCFPFENLLGKLKRLVRSPNLPLQQVINRLREQQSCNAQRPYMPNLTLPCLKGIIETDFSVGNYERAVFYSFLKTEEFTLKVKDSDNCVWLCNGQIGRIQYIFLHIDRIHVVVKLFQIIEPFYIYPVESNIVNAVRLRELSNTCCTYLVSDIKKKCFCMPLLDGSYFAVALS